LLLFGPGGAALWWMASAHVTSTVELPDSLKAIFTVAEGLHGRQAVAQALAVWYPTVNNYIGSGYQPGL